MNILVLMYLRTYVYTSTYVLACNFMYYLLMSRDIEILGWCPVGSVLLYGKKVPR